MRLHRSIRSLAAILTLVATGCSESTTAPKVDALPEAALTFLRFAATAPPPADTVVSFWAVKGEDRGVEIRFLPEAGEDEGEEFFDFEVSGQSLLRDPDGRAFVKGDSIRITVHLVDPARFVFQFEPAGLQFDPEYPAELEVSYAHADPDWDEDGEDDADLEFGFWRQEREGDLWYRMGTVFIEDLSEVEAAIRGFTRYALASS